MGACHRIASIRRCWVNSGLSSSANADDPVIAVSGVGLRVSEYQVPRFCGDDSLGDGRTAMADLPKLDVVIGNNFGHLPMFIGAEKGFFKKHGADAKMLVVDTGTDMVNAMHDGRAQIGDMSTTTYLKAVHAGEP